MGKRIPVLANISLGALTIYATLGLYFFSGVSPMVIIYLAFGLAFFGIALWARFGRRSALVASAVAAGVFFAINMPVSAFLVEPTAFPPFLFAVMSFPLASLSLFSSAATVRGMGRSNGAAAPQSRQGGVSAMLAFAAIGFIVGGLLIGSLAASTETRLISNSSVKSDITIVMGAGVQSNPLPYSPSPYTVKAGSTVTWANKDTSAHTVTSVGSNTIDSGVIPAGGTYSFTFTQPGTYQYYCTIHPWMKGTIVVTSG